MSIAVGDRVQLKSGGPEMTVDEIAGRQARCLWHDESRRLQSNWISLTALQPAPEPMVVEWFCDFLAPQPLRGHR